MDTFQAIQQRRAVKHYDPDHQMTTQEKEKLLSHAILSPTSFNIQNWRYLIVEDKATREKLCEAAWNQVQVKEASMLLILCADLKTWEKNPARYWKDAPKPVQDFLVPAIGNFYKGKEQLQRDEAMRSCGITAQTIMLAAKAMGYDSCPMVGFDYDQVAKIINLPKDYVIGMFISIGKAKSPAHPRGGQLSLDEVVIYDTF